MGHGQVASAQATLYVPVRCPSTGFLCSVLITELCDTDVTEITELPAEEANGQTYALKPHAARMSENIIQGFQNHLK